VWKKIVRSLVIALLLTGIFILIIGASIALPTFDPSKLNVEYKETVIYDRNDQPIMTFQATPGEPVRLNEIPKSLQHALVAVEDSRFYDHNGIDFKAIGRAIYRDILTGSLAEGGSTLTQQLAKNVYLTLDKTLSRKVKEIYLAAQIERNYSKEDILELYFNRIYFGHGANGIKMAAEVYFDKGEDMNRLTLAEMALLAGLPNAPSAYDPYVNMQLSMERRNQVLAAMEKEAYITPEQRAQAEKEPIKLVDGKNFKGGDKTQFPYYLDYILEEAENKLGITAEQILRGGVKVYTNLDSTFQKTLEQEYNNPANFPPNAGDGMWAQSASVIVEPETGGIVALIGGRDKEGHALRGFNRASMAKVRPGSTFKPIIGYAPAIDLGKAGPATKINNKLTKFPGGYQPQNYDGRYSDSVTLDYALTWSLNVPAVTMLQTIGIDTGWEYATKNFGLPLEANQKTGLGIALGSVDVTPLDMAGAYTAFANEGVRMVPYAIKKIVNDEGKVIGEIKPEAHNAIKPETAKLMTKLMKNVVDQGTGTNARMPGYDVAGKTGTQEMDGIKSGNRSAWFAGYTPEMVMVTWMGFDNTDSKHYLTRGSEMPAALFKKVMTPGLKNYKNTKFDLNVKAQEPKEEEKKDDAIVKDLSVKLSGTNKAQISWSPVKQEGVRYVLFRAEKLPDGSTADSGIVGEYGKPGAVDTVVPGKTYLYNVGVYKDQEKLSDSNFAELTVPGGTPQEPKKPTDPAPIDPQQPGGGGTQPNQPQQPGNGGTTKPTDPAVPNQPNTPGTTKPDPQTPPAQGGSGGNGGTAPPVNPPGGSTQPPAGGN